MKKSRKSSRKLNFRQPTVVAIVVTSLVLLVLILELTNTTHFFHKSPVPPIIPVTTNTSSTPTKNQNTQTQSSGPKDSGPLTANGSPKVNLPLYTPYGDFVSNHHPNLSGSPAPSKETSVCNTTPGVKCYIRFTKGSVTTSLPPQITDSKGTTYWNWDVKTAGMSAGDWTIAAVATLNGKTKTTQDPLPLSVSN